MIYTRRVVIAVIWGFICGVLCYMGGKLTGFEVDNAVKWSLILNRTMIGFIIGISAMRIHYLPHGLFMGFIGSIPVAVPAMYNDIMGLPVLLVSGMIWGAVIEFGTTKLMKAPVPSLYPPKRGE